jgi:uncharacterized protein YegL
MNPLMIKRHYHSDDDQLDFRSTGEEISTKKVNMVLLFDTSHSMADKDVGMQNSKIFELNRVFQKFVKLLETNKTARSIGDIVIMTFGANDVSVVSSYDPIEKLKKIKFVPIGNTPMCEAIKKAHEGIIERRQYYKDNEIQNYKPVIIVVTDGEANDYEKHEKFAKEFKKSATDRKFKFYPFYLGAGQKLASLKAFTPDSIEPRLIKDGNDLIDYFYTIDLEAEDPNKDPWEKFFSQSDDEDNFG